MNSERASKKQRELLIFVDGFIKGNGYGPSYREIMRSLGYKSVSTVAVHIDGLIARGYLRKRDNSARSIEVVSTQFEEVKATKQQNDIHTQWLQAAIEQRLDRYEQHADDTSEREIMTLLAAAQVLGMSDAVTVLQRRLDKAHSPTDRA
jgi:repressor LexA